MSESVETALVTGAGGFTGSRLAAELARRGRKVQGMLRPGGRLPAELGTDVEAVFADLARPLPSGLLDGVDTVFHVAAVYRKEGLRREEFFEVNEAGTQRLLEAALAAGVKRFVHCSTVGVLGDVKNGPADETWPHSPHDAYQESKLAGELLALKFWRERGLPVTVVRPGAIYGPGDLRFLKLFRGINNGVFRMIGSGENYYHLVYIDDLVDGMIRASVTPAAVGEVYIVAGEQAIQVKDLVKLVAEVLGKPAPRGRVPFAPVMLAAQVMQAVLPKLGINPPLYPRRLDFFSSSRSFSIAKARQALGYIPQMALRDGLSCTAEWYRQNGYLK